ncbi:MAG TPA: hypothetical protein VM389_08530 [Phycisphaerae bacterium]|nr:hypothetical protein [Phycisphaerae bacterium]
MFAAAAVLAAVVGAGGALAADPGGGKLEPPQKGNAPERVAFFIYVLDIDEINAHEQNFAANVVLRLRWKDQRLAHPGPGPRIVPLEALWHPNVVLANRQALVRTPFGEVLTVNPDGTVLYRQQYVGPLSQRLRLHDFPLDRQTFTVQFAITGMRAEDMELVPDPALGGLIPGGPWAATAPSTQGTPENPVGGGMAKVLSLPDWEIVSYKTESRPYQVSEALAVPGFAFEFVARRHVAFFIWQGMLPLALIVMMSWAPFWIDPSKVELQFGIAGSTVLTLIAYRFTLARLLPALPYLTRMDLLTIGGTILVFLSFLEVTMTSVLVRGQRAGAARSLDKVCRFLFPAAFAGVIVWSMLL